MINLKRNQGIFIGINLMLFISIVILLIIKETALIGFLTVFLLCINFVCLLAFYRFFKLSNKLYINTLLVISVLINISSFLLIAYSTYLIFGGSNE